ncbi:MAG: tetratricopeptide repeat protein [Aequorivita sp.]
MYLNLAPAFSRIDDLDSAFETLKTLIKKDPSFGRAYYLRGLLNFEANRDAAAISDLNKSIAIDSTNTRASYNLATYYYQNKEWNKAEKAIKVALKIEPQNGEYRYLLALIYEGQGKTAESAALIKQLQQEQVAVRN